MKDTRLQPLTRMVARIHVLEKARHMTFARQEVERMMPPLSRAAKAWHQVVTAQTSFMVARSLINPQMYAEVGLDPEVARKAAFTNPEYQATMAWMAEKVLALLDEQQLLPTQLHPVWKRSLLMPA
jgi:hypothetical protein